MSKNDFIGENNYYGRPKEDESIIKYNDNNFPMTINDSNPSDVLDFSDSLAKLAQDLDVAINKKTPRFIWLKERQNNKIRLDNEYLVLLKEKIGYLRSLSEEFLQFHAEAVFSQEHLNNLLLDRRLSAKRYFEDQELQFLIQKLSLEQQAIAIRKAEKELDINLDKSKAEIEQIRADNAIKLAQADKLNSDSLKIAAEAKLIDAQAEALREKSIIAKLAIGEIKFSDLPKSHQTYIFVNYLNTDATKLNDFDIQEKLKDIVIQQAKAEADKKEAEADSLRADVTAKEFLNKERKGKSGL